MIVMATKKTPAKKTAAKKSVAKKAPAAAAETATETKAEVIPIKEATEVTDEALALDPVRSDDETDDVVESEVTVEVEDPVANAIDILSATGLNTPRDAVSYQRSFVESYPDIDDLVDRKTERAALLGYQAYMRGGDRALERFLCDHWGVPQPRVPTGAHAASMPSSNPAAGPHPRRRAVDRPERWVPKVPPLAGPQGSAGPPTTPMGSLQTMEQAFDDARKEGDFL